MTIIDDRTAHLSLALPNVANTLEDDVARLRSALNTIDGVLNTTPSNSDLSAAIAGLINSAPGALDTLNELAAALNNDPSFAAGVTTALAGKAPLSHTHAISDVTGLVSALAGKLSTAPATASVLGGIKVGFGLSVAGDGTLSAPGGAGGSSQIFTELVITPSSNGQTVFTPAGGYSTTYPIEIFKNGVRLTGGGDDYTASNGTTFTLAVGVNTTDQLVLRKWTEATISGAVAKAGDTMTGLLVLSADPSATLGAATKGYVDAAATSLTASIATKAPAANPTLTGTIAQNGSVRTAPVAIAAVDVACGSGNYFTKTVAGNTTFTVSGVPASGTAYGMMLSIVHTSGTITWFSGVTWPGAVAPTLVTGKTHLFFFTTIDGGAAWRGAALPNY